MTFIPSDKNKTIARWAMPVLSGFSLCVGLVGAHSTVAYWNEQSYQAADNRLDIQRTQLRTKKEIAQIEQQATISEVHQQAKILDYRCGTTLNGFAYNPGHVDQDLINWGLNANAPIFNPVPDRWYPLYAQSGHLIAAVRNGAVITIDTDPAMDAGEMCSNGQLK